MRVSRGILAALLILAAAWPAVLAQRAPPPPPSNRPPGGTGPTPTPRPPPPVGPARPPPPVFNNGGGRHPPPPTPRGTPTRTPGGTTSGTTTLMLPFPPSPYAPLNNPALMCLTQDLVNPQTGGQLGVVLDATGQPTWNPLSASPDIAKLYITDQPASPFVITPFQDKWKPMAVLAPTGDDKCRTDGSGHCIRSFQLTVSDEKLRPFDNVVKRCPLGNFIDATCVQPAPAVPGGKLPTPTCTRVDKPVYDGTWFLTYDGMVPGPMIITPTGHEAFVRFVNRICTTELAGIVDPLAPPPPPGFVAPQPDQACIDQAAGPKGIFFTNGIPLPIDLLIAGVPIPPSLCAARTDRNGLPAPSRGRAISVHHHGSASLAPFDGWAEDITCWGETKDYVFPINRPTTAWYHDHALHITQFNALFGLSAMLVHSAKQADGGCGEPWNLDNIPELPMQLGDKLLDHTCQQYKDITSHEYLFFGDINMVNGVAFPVMDLEPKTYRFRFLNAAVSRPYVLKIRDSITGYPDVSKTYCKVIAGDGGFRQTPVAFPVEGLLIATAERYEIVCDFTQLANKTLYLWNERDLVSFDGGALHHNNVPHFCWSHLVAQIRVGPRTTASTAAPRLNLAMAPPPDAIPIANVFTQADINTALSMANAGEYHRQFEFAHVGGIWTINGDTWDTARVAANDIGQNTWELWKLVAGGQWFHPIHIHLIDAFIVKRVTFRGALVRTFEQMTPKDVIFLGPTNQVYVIIRFGAHKGEYMFHCHNLVHEDLDMMRSFQVRDAAVSMANTPGTPSRTATADPWLVNDFNNVVYSNYQWFDPIDGLACKDTVMQPGTPLCDGPNGPGFTRPALDSTLNPPAFDAAVQGALDTNYYRIFYPTQADKDSYAGRTNPWQADVCAIKPHRPGPTCNHATPGC